MIENVLKGATRQHDGSMVVKSELGDTIIKKPDGTEIMGCS
jgi:hypothetical protein